MKSGKGNVRGSALAKGGRREEGYVGTARKEGHRKLEARLEAARSKKKLEKVAREGSGQKRQERKERKKEEGKMCKKDKGDVEGLEEKVMGRKDVEEEGGE